MEKGNEKQIPDGDVQISLKEEVWWKHLCGYYSKLVKL